MAERGGVGLMRRQLGGADHNVVDVSADFSKIFKEKRTEKVILRMRRRNDDDYHHDHVTMMMLAEVVVVMHLLQLRQLMIRPSRANDHSERRFLDSNCNPQTKETSNNEPPDNEGDGDVFDGC
jgi:hypothetical protein